MNYKLYFLLFLFACNNTDSKQENKINIGQDHKRERIADSLVENNDSITLFDKEISIYNKQDLVGVWGIDTVSNAIIVFEKDSLYYVEHLGEYYFYDIDKDTLNIYLNGYLSKEKIKFLNNDMIVLEKYDHLDTLIRRN